MKKTLALFIYIWVAHTSLAQNIDTLMYNNPNDSLKIEQDEVKFPPPILDSINVKDEKIVEVEMKDSILLFKRIEEDWFSAYQIQPIDTTLDDFYQTNPNFYHSNFYQTLGNTGLASQNLFYAIDEKIGFRYQKDVFDIYNIKKQNLKLYQVNPTFSEIYYKLAPDKEQIINFALGQRIYKKLILGLDIDIINSVGAFYLQKTQNRRVALTADYATANEKYKFQAYYIHNKHVIQENGGIANDSLFENNVESDRLIYSINLYNSQNLSKNAEVYLKHSYELGNPLRKGDERTRKSGFNLGKLQHQFKYHRQGISFEENYNRNNLPVNFYPAFNYDSLQTKDSVYYDIIENTISWNNSSLYRTPKSLGFNFGISQRFIRFKDTISDNTYNQIVLHGKLSKSIYKNWKVGGEIEYVQGNINANDFKISGRLQGRITHSIKFSAYINQINRSPYYFHEKLNSNHFIWKNNFEKENIIQIGGLLHLPFINGGVKYSLLSNYVFLNTDIQPEQLSSSFSLLQFYLNPIFNFGKFKWISHLYIQKSTSEKAIEIPLIAGKTNFNYSNSLFDKALYYQVGISARYHTKYYADKYMPAIRAFYRQDDSEIGNYTYASIYVGLQIKRTNILFKYRNITQGLTDYNYYGAPHYPLKDRGLELAISWRFYD